MAELFRSNGNPVPWTGGSIGFDDSEYDAYMAIGNIRMQYGQGKIDKNEVYKTLVANRPVIHRALERPPEAYRKQYGGGFEDHFDPAVYKNRVNELRKAWSQAFRTFAPIAPAPKTSPMGGKPMELPGPMGGKPMEEPGPMGGRKTSPGPMG